MKYNKILFNFFIFCLFFLLNNKVKCQTFLPVSYATHRLYSFEKSPPHEIRNNILSTISNFLVTKLEKIRNRFQRKDKDDDIKIEYEASLKDQIKSLLQQAKNKRILSKKIKESYNRALKNVKNRLNGSDHMKITKVLDHNLEQINYLNKKSDYLEKRAEDLKKHLQDSSQKNYKQNNTCDISKVGKLKFVTSANGLKHSIDNVNGKINQNGFSIFYKNKKKMTYYWNIIELPIKLIGNIEQCFYFGYKNSSQIFCAENKLKTNSWINSLTEASFCHNFGLKGILVNTDISNDKLIKKEKLNENVLAVDIKPEESSTRVFVNDVEQKMKNNQNVIDLNQIKKKMEDEKKIKKQSGMSNEAYNQKTFEAEKGLNKKGNQDGYRNEDEDEDKEESDDE